VGSPYFWLYFVKDHCGHLAKISVMLLPDLGVFQNRLDIGKLSPTKAAFNRWSDMLLKFVREKF
jgi:hypothetical protein